MRNPVNDVCMSGCVIAGMIIGSLFGIFGLMIGAIAGAIVGAFVCDWVEKRFGPNKKSNFGPDDD